MSRFTTRHGFSRRGDRTYSSWTSMRNRCNNPQNHAFDRYGGRGITVCERWDAFENFLSDMGECPPGMSIERKDNARGYEPGTNVLVTTWKTPSGWIVVRDALTMGPPLTAVTITMMVPALSGPIIGMNSSAAARAARRKLYGIPRMVKKIE